MKRTLTAVALAFACLSAPAFADGDAVDAALAKVDASDHAERMRVIGRAVRTWALAGSRSVSKAIRTSGMGGHYDIKLA